jgi:hypothetical protein
MKPCRPLEIIPDQATRQNKSICVQTYDHLVHVDFLNKIQRKQMGDPDHYG